MQSSLLWGCSFGYKFVTVPSYLQPFSIIPWEKKKFAPRGLEVNHPSHRLSLPHLGIHLDIRQQRGIYEDVPRIESLCLTTSAEADHPNSFGVYHLQLLMDIEPCLYCLLNIYIYINSIVHISNIIG